MDQATNDHLIDAIDNALDALLAIPSPSVPAFFQKLLMLQIEYGLNVQPRHIAAIFADVAQMVWPPF